MEGIKHRTVKVNGIAMHVAEKGEGPVVLLLHGFPELWYSWRHQILSLAARGFRAVAPDLRGFGDSDVPPAATSYSLLHLVGDLVALIHSLHQVKVFVVGHDWGAIVAWHLCLIRPDLVRALVNLSVAFKARSPGMPPVDSFRAIYGNDRHVCLFQEPGVVEAAFAQVGTRLLLKKFLTYHKPTPLTVPRDKGFGGSPGRIDLPPWLSEEDLDYYASKFEKTGFTGGLNYYRCINLNWELTAPLTGVPMKVPVKFIIGDIYQKYYTWGMKDFIHKGGFKDVPFLEEAVVMAGAGHFINQEKPDEVSDHIYNFICRF